MKKFKNSLVFIIFTFLFIFHTNIFAGKPIYVEINDVPLTMSDQPVIENDRVMVPMRDIFTALGYKMEWDNESRMIFAGKDNLSFAMQIGNKEAVVNNKLTYLDTPPFIRNDKTFVPLRFVSTISGAEVSWIPENNLVKIHTNTNTVENLKNKVVMIYTQNMQGSGCIISEDGLIATNYHVIDKCEYVKIKFNDGTLYTGEVKLVGFDVAKDIAILKINKNTPNYSKIANYAEIKKDSDVITISSPNAKLNVVTYGKVTDFDKNNICFSAKIENGSSGGALFDKNGKLLGITTASTKDEKSFFAIPAYFINEVSLNKNLDVSKAGLYTNTSYPVYGIYTKQKNNNSVDICFGRVLGADYYKLYESDSLDGVYKDCINPGNGKNKWTWGFPESINVSNVGKRTYFVLSAVKNGVESKWSEPFYIN